MGRLGGLASHGNNALIIFGTENLLMKQRHQWRTLPTCSDITTAEIRDDVDAGQFRQQRAIINLPRVAKFGSVSDSLAMGANRINLYWIRTVDF